MPRLSQSLDRHSIEPTYRCVGVGVVVARGRINGSKVIVYGTYATARGGSIGVDECPPIAGRRSTQRSANAAR